jgi:hypothetical protein
MEQDLLDSNIRFSKLYSTLYSVPTKDLKYGDLYKSEQFKKWLQKPDFGLYLWSSSPWSWKTTTAIKLAKHLMNKWYKTMALSLIDYKSHLKKTFWNNDKGVKNFYDYIYRYDYILLDDISYWVSWDWVQEIMKDLLDYCFNNWTPKLILTAQTDVQNLPVHNALKSRIKWITHSIQFPEKDIRASIKFDF